MLIARDLELVVGGRRLLEPVSFQVAPGDRIGLVGRNGAGKTTLARVLAGEALPASGSLRRANPVAYLPQDPRTGDLEMSATARILGSRHLDEVVAKMESARLEMGSSNAASAEAAMRRYSRLEERFHSLGGWAAEAEAASIASSLGLPDRVMSQHLGTLSGGQRRRVELSRVLFSGATTLVLDEPTNHL
ncbi:MAG: ATP-binding cassette domain-containing protein, partial [Acidimicrobiales bacterium]